MPDKTAIHNNLTCVFNEADHTYKILETGDLLTSVTTVVKRYTPPFNAPIMAQRMVDKKKAAYVGMTADEIIQQWQEKAKLAAHEGTLAHAYAEQWPETQGYGFYPQTYRVLLMSQQIDKILPKLLRRFRIVEAEKLIFSPSMGVGGQIDLLMADDRTKEGIILDWKFTSTISDESGAFGTMLAPLEHLKHCDVVKYGLQLGLYEKILNDENYYPEFIGYRKTLIHIREMFGRVIKVKNYTKEIKYLML